MAKFSRRTFLNSTCAGLVGASFSAIAAEAPAAARKKMAIVTTEWRRLSHAQHMGDRFLVGYPVDGKWHEPALDVASLYVDQTPNGDLSRERAAEFGFKIYPTITEALRAGGDRLAVDAVLTIGEHGTYPNNELGQKLYPRYEFFKQIVDVFRADGRTVPVFNDKHLSWKWAWAKEMVETSRALKFPFMAGSSLPVTWRMPSIDMPLGAEVEEVMCVAIGGVDSYDFHALEVIQCMAERRRGGETGVAWMHALRGDTVWKAFDAGSWAAGGWTRELFDACISRSQTLTQPRRGFNHRRPSDAEMRELVKDPVAYRFQYNDGLAATMLILNGLVGDFTFAARLKSGVARGERSVEGRASDAKLLSTLFYLPPTPNVQYSAELMSKVEGMFLTGKAPTPIDRTLLTTGLVAAALQSLGAGQKRIDTPHLTVRYEPPRESTFAQS